MIGTLCVRAIHLPQPAVTIAPGFLSFSPALALPVWFSWGPCLSYFTAVVLLAICLSIATKTAPPLAKGLDKIILCGPVFIALPMAVFGTEHYLAPAGVGRMIPAWIFAHNFWVYFVGSCLILGGLSIVLQKYAWLAAGLFGIMLLCFEVLMHIPRVVVAPHNSLAWELAFRDFSFGWGALSFAATHAQEQEWRTNRKHWLISVVRIAIGIVLGFFAVEYFLHSELLPGVLLRQLTPSFIPGHLLWGYVTGVVYVGASVCLLINKEARRACSTGRGICSFCRDRFFVCRSWSSTVLTLVVD
jgi:uncharacterized membrane protein